MGKHRAGLQSPLVHRKGDSGDVTRPILLRKLLVYATLSRRRCIAHSLGLDTLRVESIKGVVLKFGILPVLQLHAASES